jgi:phasin family protein
MSDTTKTSDPSRKVQDTVARSAQATNETASRMARETTTSADVMANATAEAAKSAERTTETATEAGAKVASFANHAAKTGLSATADASGHMAGISHEHSRRLLTSTVQAMDIYTDATERSAERLQALMASALTLTCGLQKMQHAWLEILNSSMERATHRPQDLLRCKTLTEVAEVQRDLYTSAINHAFESSSRLLELASQTAGEAVRPLQDRMH